MAKRARRNHSPAFKARLDSSLGVVRKNSMVKFITRLLSALRQAYHGNGKSRASIKSIIDLVVCARPAGPMYRMASMTASPLLDARKLNGEHPRSATPAPRYRRVDSRP
jgi:hypothetical protein